MSEENILLTSIMPTSEMSFYTTIETTESILRDLKVKITQLGSYILPLSSYINSKKDSFSKFSNSFPNSFIFDILDDPMF